MENHAAYKFSITVRSDDLPTVYALRGLADYSQTSGNKRIAWGGTTDESWRRNSHQVTFRFSTTAYRANFEKEAARLLPSALWSIVVMNDNDPAKRRRR